jgi:hypothetical protein
VHRIIGRIKVEDDFAGRSLMRVQEKIDQQPLDGDRIVADLVVAVRLELLRSCRFNVDLPATGAQSCRRASSLPASTAIIGS